MLYHWVTELPCPLEGAIQVLRNVMGNGGVCQISGKNITEMYSSALLALRGEMGCQMSKKKANFHEKALRNARTAPKTIMKCSEST